MIHKIHYDKIKAHVKTFPDEDRLSDPKDLELMSILLYKAYERQRGGLHYSSYQEQWIAGQLIPNSTAAENFLLS